MIEVLILFLCSALSLFLLFVFSKNDFVLLRKNISLTRIFDTAFISVIGIFLMSRLFFILNSTQFEYFHILRFLHIAYYPGLSLLGAYVGLIGSLAILYRKSKALFKIFDIFSTSFITLIAGFIVVRSYPSLQFALIYCGIAVFILLILFMFIVRFNKNFTLRDGSITALVAMFISIDTLVSQYYSKASGIIGPLSFLQIAAGVVLVCSVGFFIFNQYFRSKKR